MIGQNGKIPPLQKVFEMLDAIGEQPNGNQPLHTLFT